MTTNKEGKGFLIFLDSLTNRKDVRKGDFFISPNSSGLCNNPLISTIKIVFNSSGSIKCTVQMLKVTLTGTSMKSFR